MEKPFEKREYFLLGIGALAAGFLNGLLGAGGGIALYFVLGALYGRGAKENLILASSSVFFFCLVSLFFYKGNAALPAESILSVGIPAAFGGVLGAFLLRKIPQAVIKKIFAAVILISGVLMLVR